MISSIDVAYGHDFLFKLNICRISLHIHNYLVALNFLFNLVCNILTRITDFSIFVLAVDPPREY